MLKIAITGNIASGKSLVLNCFKGLNVPCLSLDTVVENIYKNKDFQKKLCLLFGTALKSDISKIVFADKTRMQMLEKIIFPPVKVDMENFFKYKEIAVVEAPMLFEAGFDKFFDKIIFVSADREIRKARLMKRNNFTEEEALLRIDFQNKEGEKIKKADFVIYNNGNKKEVESECKEILAKLKAKLLP